MLGVLDADHAEVGLLPGGPDDVAGGEELAAVQPAREVEDAGALHDGVVDVEEGRGTSGRWAAERVLDLGGRRGGLAGEGRALLQVEPARSLRRGHPASLAASLGGDAVEGSRHAAHRRLRVRGRGCRGRAGAAGAGRERWTAPSRGPASRTRWPGSRPGSARRGSVAGQRVMILVGNRIEFVTAYLGVLRAQVVAVPVNPRSTAGEVARMIADSGTRLVVVDDTAARRRTPCAGAAPRAGRRRCPDGGRHRRRARAGRGRLRCPARATSYARVPPLPDPEKLAVLLYTSGTSGRPRAAMLSHRALLANIEQVASVEPPMMHGDDVVLGVLPLFHVYGLNAVLGGVLRHRARLLLVDALRAAGGARPDRRRGVQRRADRAARLRPLAARRAPARAAGPGPAGAVRLGAAGGAG